MNTKNVLLICVMLLFAIPTESIASKSSVTLMDFRPAGTTQSIERKIEFKPLTSAGLLLSSDDIAKGNFMSFSWNYPRTIEAFAELSPECVSRNAHVVGPDGGEYVSSAVMPVIAGSVPAWRFTGVVIGLRQLIPGLKGVTLSVRLDKAYRLSGEEITEFEPDKWRDGEYRRNFVLTHGTPLAETPVSEFVKNEIMNWNVYETEVGLIASPWSEDRVREMAEMNPAYSFFQRLVKVGNFRLSMSVTATFTGAGMDVVRALGAKSSGLDWKSEQSLLRQGRNLMYMDVQYKMYCARRDGLK
jgi:hypothetical protein